MQTIIIQSARATWVGYLVVALVLVLAGVVLMAKDSSSPLGWGSLILAGCVAFVAIRQLLDRRPRITIDDNGIVDRTLRYGLIEWNDIEGAYLQRKSVGTFICLQLRDAKKYTDRLPPIVKRLVSRNAKVGATPVPLNLTGTDVNPEEILHVIENEVRARWSARAVHDITNLPPSRPVARANRVGWKGRALGGTLATSFGSGPERSTPTPCACSRTDSPPTGSRQA